MKDILKHKKLLGVINITPNSFSDGGLNLNPQSLKKNLIYFSQFKNLIWDIGAESTAPMNSKISTFEEIKRFNYFFKVIDSHKIKVPEIISIDTYKIEVFDFVYQQLKKRNAKVKVLFNDVSGHIDEELIQYLKNNPDVIYIYCLTKNVTRENVHDHMKNYTPAKDIVLEMMESFYKIHSVFKLNQLKNSLVFDPCFGFSKSIDENWEILENFDRVIKLKSDFKLSEKILIGVSKKSFIHKLIASENPKEDSELVHFKIINELSQLDSNSLLFRIHDPELANLALK